MSNQIVLHLMHFNNTRVSSWMYRNLHPAYKPIKSRVKACKILARIMQLITMKCPLNQTHVHNCSMYIFRAVFSFNVSLKPHK